MSKAIQVWFMSVVAWTAWLGLALLASSLQAQSEDSRAKPKIQNESEALDLAAAWLPRFSYTVSINRNQMHSVHTIGFGIESSNQKIIVLSDLFLQAPYHPALSPWSTNLEPLLRNTGLRTQVLRYSENEFESNLSFRVGQSESKWGVLGREDGIVFAFTSEKSASTTLPQIPIFASFGEPKFFIGLDRQEKLKSFDSPESLLKNCLGGVAIDDLGNVALVTKCKDKAQIMSGTTLSGIYQDQNEQRKKSSSRIDLELRRRALVAELGKQEPELRTRQLGDQEAELALEKSALNLKNLKSRMEFAGTDLDHANEILNSIQTRKRIVEDLIKKNAASQNDHLAIQEEFLKQQQAKDLAQSKLEQLRNDQSQAELDHKRTILEMERVKLSQTSSSEQLQKVLEQKRRELAEIERKLNSKSTGSEDSSDEVSTIKQLSPVNSDASLKGKSRDEIYRMLEEQFMKDRDATAKELQQMRERMDRLEQSEKEKLKNKEAILSKRVEAILSAGEN